MNSCKNLMMLKFKSMYKTLELLSLLYLYIEIIMRFVSYLITVTYGIHLLFLRAASHYRPLTKGNFALPVKKYFDI